MSISPSWSPEFSTIDFTLSSKSTKLSYTDSGVIAVEQDGKCAIEIKVGDVIGCALVGEEFIIYNYPTIEPRCGSSSSSTPRPRRSSPVVLLPTTPNSPKIQSLISFIRTLATGTSETRKLLVMVNPCSGKKKGLFFYNTVVRRMLSESNCSCDLLITTHAGHATDRLREGGGDLSIYNGVIAVGGDGLLYEMLQGMESRGDRTELMKRITFGIVPAGSGNGLAASVVHARGEADGILENTFIICKNGSKPCDLSLYTTSLGNRYLSFLALSWGIVADVDLESEVLRALGPLRFDVYAVWRMISLKRYDGTFSYLPSTSPDGSSSSPVDQPVPSDWITMEERFLCLWALQTTHASQNMYTSPGSTMDDGLFHVVLLTDECSRLQLLQSFLAFETGGHVNHKHVKIVKCRAYRLTPTSDNSHVDLDGEEIEYGPVQAEVEQSAMRLYY